VIRLMPRWLLLLLALLPVLASGAEPLDPNKAFRLSVRALDPATVEVQYRIADGYYMYREKFAFAAEPATARLGQPEFPKGEVKQDEFFGRVETYRNELRIRLPVEAGAERFNLLVTSQGCWDGGICYPPLEQSVEVNLIAASAGANASGGLFSSAPAAASPDFGGRAVTGEPSIISDEGRFAAALASGDFLLTLAIFFGAGLLLTFTPCVLPMIPILSGIIVGEGRSATKARALALSATYVLGMAVTYTAIGVLAAMSGAFLAAALQNAWVLGAFALVFVALALSMFGFYDLQLPSALQSRITDASARLKGGQIGAVALMGVLSAAIVSPCVAAPLAGALLYISQTRDAVLGGAALFAMALGMGVPLIAVGVTEGALLP
jgi:thiol:disulfide interchange protein DsbD